MGNELPRKTRKRINADAQKWSEMQYGHDDVNKDYLEGALHEAGLAQEAEQRADRYDKALKAAQAKAKQGIFPHLPVETMGAQMCIEIYQLVTEALTPKTSTDDTVNG